eukprot:g8407.t1
MEIFFSVGEPSGDQHAAHLMDEIAQRRPGVRFSGFGGPMMEERGCRLLFRLTDLAVMFIWSVVPQLATFYRLVQQAKRYFRETPPDAVVLVDYPGFNWWIARKAKAAGIPVFYYLPPQLWAWGSYRVNKMRKFVDHILCGLPFEPKWYARRGLQAEYVGHPFFDEIEAHQLDTDFCEQQSNAGQPIVGVLPGSRNKEIERNWPLMMQVMQQLHARHPDVRFLVASYNEKQRARCEELLQESNAAHGENSESGTISRLPIEFHIGHTPEIIETARCCLMVSGSVSLELLARTTPAAVVYRINTMTRFFKWLMLQIRYITLPNLIAEAELMPEWVVCPHPERDVREMTATLSSWLSDSNAHEAKVAEIRELRDAVMKTGATRLTADAILRRFSSEEMKWQPPARCPVEGARQEELLAPKKSQKRSRKSTKRRTQSKSTGNGTTSNGTGNGAADNVKYVSLSDETRRRYLNYALSVITSRALPDVRDGLKPVQRRIMYVMYDGLRLTADSKRRKSMKVCGDTTGNYHPHGEGAVYETLVRLAQDFTLREPLVDGQGNFGSIMGLPHAAARYTEVRLTAIAEHLMNELRYQTVDTRATYDGERDEPVVLPARFPNLLVNGTQGIAVGMATNIPPHNLGEVIKACVYLINHPGATVAKLMNSIKGPDFPLGGRVVTDRRTIRKAYEEGRGSIKVRAEWRLDKERRREIPNRIVVYSVPYGVSTNPLMEAFGEIINSPKLPQLVHVGDETSERNGLRLVLELKPGSDPDAVMAYLYKHTALEQNFAFNTTCLVPDEHGALVPARLSLLEMLQHFLDFRFSTVRRRFEFQLDQLERRIHILEGMAIIFKGLDKALKIIRNSSGKQDAAVKLMKAFPLDELQTYAILELQLYRISQLEIDNILEELDEKRSEAAAIRRILASNKRLWKVVQKELEEIAEKFSDRRRTTIGSVDEIAEYDPQAYIIRENTNVVVTREGWLKRVGRLQKVESTRVREGDIVQEVVPGSTLENVVLFASDGAAYTLPIDQIPVTTGYGEPLAKHVRMGDGASIVAAMSTDPRFTDEDRKVRGQPTPAPYLLIATAHGQVMRLSFSAFRSPSTKLGRKFCRLRSGDRVVFVEPVADAKTMFLATKNARVLHFHIKDVPLLASAGKGVIGIKLEKGDQVLGGIQLSRPSDALRVINTNGKALSFGQMKYGATSRGHGTKIFFRPDDTIFRRVHFNADTIRQHLEDISYIHGGLHITFVDETKNEKTEFSHPEGISAYLEKLTREGQKQPVHEQVLAAEKDDGSTRIELVMRWSEATDEEIRSYVNGIRTRAGGTHESGFRSGIAKAVKNYMDVHNIKQKGLTINNDDIREGIVGILSVFHGDPMFQGQTKERLNNPELLALVDAVVRPALENWLNNNPSIADAVVGRIVLAARAREASRAAVSEVRRKSPSSKKTNLPGKLVDCRSKEPDECELFIVEGDSAGGTAVLGRNSLTQAVLPLRGKILNTESLGVNKILGNAEIHALVETLGTGIANQFDIRRLRYGRIILLMDADSDGYHISTLLLTFFFRHMRELIRQGKVFIGQPPLYRISVGKETRYAQDDLDKEELLASLPPNRKPEITRFKGLGEMDADQLRDTTLDPKHRTLVRVDIESQLDADKTFQQLLGKDASERYKIIMDEASFADDATDALILLVSMYVGSISGGLISATLLRMPGTPASIMTTLDGYPMAQSGRAGRALGLGISASFVGGVVSWGFLLLLAEPMAKYAVLLGPFEMFALVMMALVLIASVSEGSIACGIFSGLLGMLCTMPGASPSDGRIRWTLGFEELNGGLKLLPVLVGLFAVSQVIRDILTIDAQPKPVAVRRDGLMMSLKDFRSQAVNLLRSSVIGTWVGILPGIGANIGSVMAYSAAKNASDEPESFGKGAESGIVASEAANNATVGGALIPLVAMGIPGSVIDAILLGAMVIHGLQPGPQLFAQNPEGVYTIMAAVLVANVAMLLMMTTSVRWLARLTSVPRAFLIPIVLVFCVVGSFALAQRMFDVGVMLAFGLAGFVMERTGLPLAPFVIGFVLAPVAEYNLSAGLMSSAGSYLPLVTRPVTLVFLLIALFLLAWPVWKRRRDSLRASKT